MIRKIILIALAFFIVGGLLSVGTPKPPDWDQPDCKVRQNCLHDGFSLVHNPATSEFWQDP